MKQTIMKKYFSLIGYLAKRSLKPSNLIIGFTGSVWKTSSRMIVSQVLKDLSDRNIYTSNQNFNGELGLPLSILWIEKHSPNIKWLVDTLANATIKSFFWTKKYDILLIEYWIDHIWEMDFMLSIVKPDISITTIIDKVHWQSLWTPEKIAKEKYKLAQNTKLLPIICNDDPYINIWKEIIWEKKYISYWKKSDIEVMEFEIIEKNWLPVSKSKIQINWETFEISSNLTSETSIQSIGIGIYIAKFLGHKIEKNLQFNISLLAWRENFLSWKNNLIILDSSYNASPASMKKMLSDTKKLSKMLERKTLLFLWDMRELWDISKTEHENLAKDILDTNPEKVFLVWEQVQFLAQALIKNGYKEENIIIWNKSDEIWKKILDFIEKNDNKYLLLAKGSQNTIFLEEGLKHLIPTADHSKLVRQSDDWITKKQKYFSSL